MKIPKTWRFVRVGDIGEVQGGRQRSPSAKGQLRPYLRVANVYAGYIDYSDVLEMPFEDDEFERFSLEPGDILLNEGQSLELVGRSAIFDGPRNAYAFQNTLIRFRPGKSVVSSFAATLFSWLLFSGKFSEIATKTTSIAHLGVSRFSDLEVPLPPIADQLRISACVKAIEDGISNIRQRMIAARQRRHALMQRLLTGRRRFSGFTKRWRKTTVADICVEESIRNDGRLGREAVRAVNKAEGMIPMKDHVISDNLTRYKIVKPGWYAYNPMRINIGSICQWHGKDDALVSPDYVVFRCLPDKVDQRFFNAFRRSFRWDAFMARAGSGGVRIRIYFDDLGMLGLPIPELDEQRRIGAVFETVDGEIECLERLLVAHQRQKHALVQQLLTGKRRVQAPTR